MNSKFPTCSLAWRTQCVQGKCLLYTLLNAMVGEVDLKHMTCSWSSVILGMLTEQLMKGCFS